MRRIGVLGGTFDPPHYGHLVLGELACRNLQLEQVLFVLAADPPHKTERRKTAVQHRLAMLRLAIADNPCFAVSLVDVERTGPHYSVDMLRLLQAQHPQHELVFVMGGDSFRDIPKWHRPDELIKLCRFAVMRRPSDQADSRMHQERWPELSQHVDMIDAPLLDVSSTDLVRRIQAGESVRYLLPDSVLAYIQAEELYG